MACKKYQNYKKWRILNVHTMAGIEYCKTTGNKTLQNGGNKNILNGGDWKIKNGGNKRFQNSRD